MRLAFLLPVPRLRYLPVHTPLLPWPPSSFSHYTMATPAARPPKTPKPPKPPAPAKREVKILMLHGYTQSGPVFHGRTRALEKILIKSLEPFGLAPVLIYPTGPKHLRPSDFPGFVPNEDADPNAEEEETDSWAWWRHDFATGEYRFLPEGMATMAAAIREANGIDGVLGFSQGGCAASLLAAAMEKDRIVPDATNAYGWDWVEEVRAANDHKPLRFAVIYSGFLPTIEELQWLYTPAISTPTLQFIGGLDTVVDESRSQALADHSQEPSVLTHPGGHFVPVKKEWVLPLVAFVKKHSEEAAPKIEE
ncbi:dihydrofolate reductase [Ophiostoma piceae UAMH 11346]|uniref:Dihydrofolate reductase n=1 Tax=Ophiostoma piceae (strain UAMH 11346) TaxID=1262450 RepID=S3CNG8_OPHP1|nr:dihydrofolate reductase [Ophiostoma piceae UAMH 11346]